MKVFLKSAYTAKVIAKVKVAHFIHPRCNIELQYYHPALLLLLLLLMSFI